MDSGAHAFYYLGAEYCDMFSLEQATETHNFLFLFFKRCFPYTDEVQNK